MLNLPKRPKLVTYVPEMSFITPSDLDEWRCIQAGADELGIRTLIALAPGLDYWAPGLEFLKLSTGPSTTQIYSSQEAGFSRIAHESRKAVFSIVQLLNSMSPADVLFFPRASISLVLGLATIAEAWRRDLPRTVLLFQDHIEDCAQEIGVAPIGGRTALGYALASLISSRQARHLRLYASTAELAEEYSLTFGQRFQPAPVPVSSRIFEISRPSTSDPPVLMMTAFETGNDDFLKMLLCEIQEDLSNRKLCLVLQLPPEMLRQNSRGIWYWRSIRETGKIEAIPATLPLDERLPFLNRTDLLLLLPQSGRCDRLYTETAGEACIAGIPLLLPEGSNMGSAVLRSPGVSFYAPSNPAFALRNTIARLPELRKSSYVRRGQMAFTHSPSRFAHFVCGVETQGAAQAFEKKLASYHFHVNTDRPVATDSPDHLQPHGTSRDNSRNYQFNRKLFALFKSASPSILDLGCSGGGFVKSCLDDGRIAIGIEGSDYSLKKKRAEWKTIPAFLFTGDVTYPFTIGRTSHSSKNTKCLFDVITSWELIEHIKTRSLPHLCGNVLRHLAPNGIWIMSVSPQEEVIQGFRLHQTVKHRSWWIKLFRSVGLVHSAELEEYFGDDWVRGPSQEALGSFHLVLHRKGERHPVPQHIRKEKIDRLVFIQ